MPAFRFQDTYAADLLDPEAAAAHIEALSDTSAPDLMIAQIRLPGTPKSLNKVGSRGSHWAWRDEKKLWEGNCFISLLKEKIPKKITRVRATGLMAFKQNRNRDEGNYRHMIEKAFGDALQLGWVPDDTPEHYRFGKLSFTKDPSPHTLLTITFRPIGEEEKG